MDRKEELRAISEKARNELWIIERDERIEANERYVGKFFKYRNSYSCPESDEYWYLYVSITGIIDSGNIEGWTFQMPIDKRIEIDLDFLMPNIIGEYTPIEKEEFWKAYEDMLDKLPNVGGERG